MDRRTAFHLDCTGILAECGCTCGKCLAEMRSVFAGTPGVRQFDREGQGVVVEYDPEVVRVEELMDIFPRLPSFYRNRFIPSIMQRPEASR